MKKATSIIFIFLLSFAVFAQHYSKPGRNEVVLVFSVEIRPSVNREFFKGYLSIPSMPMSDLITNETGRPVSNDPGDSISLYCEGDDKLDNPTAVSDAEDIISVKVPVPRSGEIVLNFCTYNFFKGTAFRFFLPFGVKIKVQPDFKYYYLGHLEYKRKGGMEYEIVDVKKHDNYDVVIPIIKKRYGENAELIRAAMTSIDKK